MIWNSDETPSLSIVIPSRSPSKGLPELLRSIETQKTDFVFEVLVVSNPGPAQALPCEPVRGKIRWLHSAPAGVNRARQTGVANARGSWLYFLDDDCRLGTADHLQKLMNRLRSFPETSIWGGPYRLWQGASRWSRAYQYLQTKWQHEGWHPEQGWRHLLGGNLAVSRAFLKKEGFDESIVFGGAETDLLSRLFRHGAHGHLDEDLPVWHRHELSRLEFLKKAMWQGFGFERLGSRGGRFQKFRLHLPDAEGAKLAREIAIYDEVFQMGRSVFLGARPFSKNDFVFLWQVERERWRSRWASVTGRQLAWGRFLRALLATDVRK